MTNSTADSTTHEVPVDSVSILDLGCMDAAIVKVFLQKGQSVFVWNCTPNTPVSLVALGVKITVTRIVGSPGSNEDQLRTIRQDGRFSGPLGD